MPIRPVSVMSVSIASKLLEISWPVTTEELTSAFRAAAKKYHPDRGGSEQQMKDVNAAYEFLKKELERIPAGARARQEHTGPWTTNGWWNTASWDNIHTTGFNWDDIWRAADEFARQQNERHRQREQARQEQAQREQERARQESASNKSEPEPHVFKPAKNPQEAMNRARVNSKEGFCILEHWQPSKNNPNNITRLFTNLGGLRCTIFWKEKIRMFGWSAYLGPNIDTAFSQKHFPTRKEAVEDLAKILFEKVEG